MRFPQSPSDRFKSLVRLNEPLQCLDEEMCIVVTLQQPNEYRRALLDLYRERRLFSP